MWHGELTLLQGRIKNLIPNDLKSMFKPKRIKEEERKEQKKEGGKEGGRRRRKKSRKKGKWNRKNHFLGIWQGKQEPLRWYWPLYSFMFHLTHVRDKPPGYSSVLAWVGYISKIPWTWFLLWLCPEFAYSTCRRGCPILGFSTTPERTQLRLPGTERLSNRYNVNKNHPRKRRKCPSRSFPCERTWPMPNKNSH